MKGLLRKRKTDLELIDDLIDSEDEAMFDVGTFEEKLGLRSLSDRRVPTDRLKEALGHIELTNRELKQARSLTAQLDMLLPAGIPPVVYEPLRYILARVVKGDIMSKDWDTCPGPAWVKSLVRLHVVSEVAGTKPWWIQALHQAVHESSGDISGLERRIVAEVSQSMNVAMSSDVTALVEKLSRKRKARIGDISRFIPRSSQYGSHLKRALIYAVRETFVPSFRRLGLNRTLIISKSGGVPKTAGGRLAEDIHLQGGNLARAQIWLTSYDKESASDRSMNLGRARTSLRLSLLDRSRGIWNTVIDFSRTPPKPETEADWIIDEERKARKTLELTERETFVLGVDWSFPVDNETRNKALSTLGVSAHSALTSRRKLYKRGAFTLRHFPAEELLGLGDEVAVLFRGERNQLSRVRLQIEAGVPYCESGLSHGKTELFVRAKVAPYTGQLLVNQLMRGFAKSEIETSTATVTSRSRTRFSAIAYMLQLA
ncbi:hypothetical protein EU524_00615 [Candidatus Thorarchaeota archaeon]|nr:MAG: hypothetical protein EU524_00615 [Candidatus Thorarchaeota archaeon]